MKKHRVFISVFILTFVLSVFAAVLFIGCRNDAPDLENATDYIDRVEGFMNDSDGAEATGIEETARINFSEDFDHEKYDGMQVTARGYMSGLSPLDGKFIYLMNIPYQSCPFCLPNTTIVVNTIAVYAKEGAPFKFYDGPIEVEGTLNAGSIVDEFGYEYSFIIEGAGYTTLDVSIMSENMKLYGALAQEGIIAEIMNLVSKMESNAFWEVYYLFDKELVESTIIKDGIFDDIIRRVNAISRTEYVDIINILEAFKEFNRAVNDNIIAGEYEENHNPEKEDEFFTILDSLFAWMNKFEV